VNQTVGVFRNPDNEVAVSVSKTDGLRDSQSNTPKVSADQPSVGASVIDVLDHVLDKGIVIDAWMKVQLVGIDLFTVEARVLVASIETYLQQADSVSHVGPFAAGQLGPIDPSSGMLRNLDGHLQRDIAGDLKRPPKMKTTPKMKMSPKTSHAPRRHRH
jgi:gas vesicle protein GvpA/GvpJ/GvpM family